MTATRRADAGDVPALLALVESYWLYGFSLEHLGLTTEIDELFVLSSHRGRGIGAELLDEMGAA